MDNHDGAAFAEKFDIRCMGSLLGPACHCRYCQLRAASAFGTGLFSLEKLQLRSEIIRYHFRTEMGRTWKMNGSTCGTTLFMYLEAWPGDVGVAGEHLTLLLFGLNFQEKYLRDRKRIL